jgi:hypothetical protein
MTETVSMGAMRVLLKYHLASLAAALERNYDRENYLSSAVELFEADEVSHVKPWEALSVGVELGVRLAVAIVNAPLKDDADVLNETAVEESRGLLESSLRDTAHDAHCMRAQIGAEKLDQIRALLAHVSREGLEPAVLGVAILGTVER